MTRTDAPAAVLPGLRLDADNPNGALRLYENAGFRVDARGAAYRKPLEEIDA